MIRFTTLTIEGFASYVSKVTLPIDAKGVNILRGDNGAGKTTLASAFSWCLFGVPLKNIGKNDVATWKHLRPTAKGKWRGTRVIQDLTVHGVRYVIARHLSYKGTTFGIKGNSTLLLFEVRGDERILYPHGKPETEKEIERLLGCDYRQFSQSVIFGQRLVRLVQLGDADKRKLFESVFDLTRFELARNIAQNEAAKLSAQISDIERNISRAQDRLAALKSAMEERKAILLNFEEEREQAVSTLRQRIDKTREDIGSAEKALQAANRRLAATSKAMDLDTLATLRGLQEAQETVVEGYTQDLRRARRKLSDLSTQLQDLAAEKAKYTKQLQSVKTACEVCGKPIETGEVEAVRRNIKSLLNSAKTAAELLEKDKPKYIASKDEYSTKLQKAQEELDRLGNEIAELEKSKKGLRDIEREVSTQERNIAVAKERLDGLEQSLIAEQSRKPPVATEDELVRMEIEDLEGQVLRGTLRLIPMRNNLMAYEVWAKKGFGPNGIKAYLFDRMLYNFNEYVNEYLAPLDIALDFRVDTEAKSKPFVIEVVMGSGTFQYEEFSGGEKQRLDIAMAFAFHDIVSDVFGFNAIWLDELFESLDAVGLEFVASLIQIKAMKPNIESLWVITHTNVIIPNSIEWTVEGGKRKKSSRLVS